MEGDGLAIAGLVLGYVHLFFWLIVVMVVIGMLFLGTGLHWF
jgi:hypothetical protein